MTDDPRTLWNKKAAHWDEYFGEGNAFHRTLVEPSVLTLLEIQPGERVLDIGAGNGALARKLAGLGAEVVAFDFSEVFIERARARTSEHADRIDYHVLDATDRAALLGLGDHRFDAAVSTMALMDIPDIEPLAATLPSLLKPQGRFVFTVMHPCFNSRGTHMFAESWLSDEGETTVSGMKIVRYLNVGVGLGGGIPGEPNPHLYYHRPLHQLLGTFFSHGFVLDGLLEPSFEAGGDPMTWPGMGDQIPPVLAVRLRMLSRAET